MVTFRPTQYPGYLAADDGYIYSVNYRVSGATYPLAPRRLKPRKSSNGNYLGVSVKDRGRFVSKDIHVIICTAFHGPRPTARHTASHLDGNSHDNRPDNLAWETHRENLARKRLHGTDDTGYRNSRAKLSKADLDDVRVRLGRGERHEDIAAIYDVARATISKINNGSRYGGV